MTKRIIHALVILAMLFIFLRCKPEPMVKIISNQDGYSLIYQSKPLFIKGIVSAEFLEKAKLYGANSVRVWNSPEDAENAQKLGLTVMYNIEVKAERDGFNFNDSIAIRKQKEKILEQVQALKNNKAIIFWSIGNELDYLPILKPYDKRVWDVVEDISRGIKKIDPDRLTLTVIGMSMMDKVGEIRVQCPSLDLLGINAYGDIEEVPEILKKYEWNKPYVITEWGPTGYWQTNKTAWGAPFEETGSQKADAYLKRYQNVMLKDSLQCLGSYVFLWTTGKQETTHTWFGMFDIEGNESEAVGEMRQLWSCEKLINQAPRLDSMNINGIGYPHNIYLESGKIYQAKVFCYDPDNDSLQIKWEIRGEANYSSYAGQGEKTPAVVDGNFKSTHLNSIRFKSPLKSGAYRLFVYIYDQNQHFATANLPFLIHPEK